MRVLRSFGRTYALITAMCLIAFAMSSSLGALAQEDSAQQDPAAAHADSNAAQPAAISLAQLRANNTAPVPWWQRLVSAFGIFGLIGIAWLMSSHRKQVRWKTVAGGVGLQRYPATLKRLARVAKLVESFESSVGMELLATVHWVMKHEGARGRGTVDAIHAWNLRKQVFTDEQILLAAKRLTDEGWVSGASA